MGLWTTLDSVQLRVTYTVPVQPGDNATLQITLSQASAPVYEHLNLCNYEVRLFASDGNTETDLGFTQSFSERVTPGPFEKTIVWTVPLHLLDEDAARVLRATVNLGNGPVTIPLLLPGEADEIFVRVTKSGGDLIPLDAASLDSNVVVARFGVRDAK